MNSFFLPSDGVVDRLAVPCGVASPSAIVPGPSGDRADPVVENENLAPRSCRREALSHSCTEPVVGNVTPRSLEKDDHSRETVETLSHSQTDPFVEGDAPSFGGDDLSGEAVGTLCHSRADPDAENVAPQSVGGDDSLGETAGILSRSCADFGVGNVVNPTVSCEVLDALLPRPTGCVGAGEGEEGAEG